MITVPMADLRQVCAVAAEYAQYTDQAAVFPTETLTAMRETRLLGLMVPAEFGGGGGGVADLVDVTVELGRVDMSVATIFAMHCQQVATIVQHGTEQLRNTVLPEVARGRIYLASVTTEAGSGGNLQTSNSQTEWSSGELHINRHSPIVTGGLHADGYLITVRTPGEDTPTHVELVYAMRDQLTLEVLGAWNALGMRATESVAMRLNGTVPSWQVLNMAGGIRRLTATIIAPLAHVGWSAAWLGSAASAYGRVVTHIRSASGRQRFDPKSDLLLTRLATTRARLDVVHALLRHTVRVIDSGVDLFDGPTQLLVNTLKMEAADNCFQVVHELVELVGLRHGYAGQSPLRLEQAFRDLRSASLNYANERLRRTNGALTLMDSQVHLV